jgi:hypothetical protein
MLAMTSIAITASICASASEVALLVASFMSFSLDSGVTHRCARRRESEGQSFTRNTPRRLFALIESPLSEHRPCQGQIVMRRHFDWLRTPPLGMEAPIRAHQNDKLEHPTNKEIIYD